MSLDDISVLAGENDQCPGCHRDFSSESQSDGARTYLSCGHSVCWKCIQTEWCRSSTNDVDMVNCPLCNVEVLICFEKQPTPQVEEQPLEAARNNMRDILQKTQMRNQPPASTCTSVQPTSGCSDVLMCQTADRYSSTGDFPDLPLTIADSIIDIAEMGPSIDFPSDHDENLHERSWSMDIMNLQDMLERNDATQHLSQDSIFSDHSDSDMGTVQDILKIANLPGESLLDDDNSLSAIFLPESSKETGDNFDSTLTNSDDSEFPQLLEPSPLPVYFNSKTSSQNPSGASFKGVEIHIKDTLNKTNKHYGRLSVDKRSLLEKLEAENSLLQTDHYVRPRRSSRGRKRYPVRGRGRGRGMKKKILSTLDDLESINMETQRAVASIQGSCTTYQSIDEKLRPGKPNNSDKLISLKENLHERFYPKSDKRLDRSVAMEIPQVDRRLKRRIFLPPKDEIEIPDMQMVKIVSDVKIPEEKERPVPDSEDSANHNYGYVKNSMLPNGNEIKNLYVVPKTWLNSDEVEVQFTPSGRRDATNVPQTADYPHTETLECQAPTGTNAYSVKTTDQQPLIVQSSQTNINNQPTSDHENNELMLQNMVPGQNVHVCETSDVPKADMQETHSDNSFQNMIQIHRLPQRICVSSGLERIHTNTVYTSKNTEPETVQETTAHGVVHMTDAPQMIHMNVLPEIVNTNAVPAGNNLNSVASGIPANQLPNTLCENNNPNVVKTTFARSLLDHTHKIIKVWSKDTDSTTLGDEVHVTQLPKHDDLISEDKFETEMVHVRYEISDDQIVFIPEESSPALETTITEKEKGPLLILKVKDEKTNLPCIEDAGTSVEKGFSSDKKQSEKVCDTSLCSQIPMKPVVSNSKESCDSSLSHIPTADSSNISSQRLFSSPESVRHEDIQEWYNSVQDNEENSCLEMIPWDEFDTRLFSQDLVDGAIECEAGQDNDIQKAELGNTDTVMIKPMSIETQVGDKEDSVNKASDVSTLKSSRTCKDGTDYGSPPELERMDTFTKRDTEGSANKMVTIQSNFGQDCSESHAGKSNELGNKTKVEDFVLHTRDRCQNDLLEAVLKQLYELSKKSETKSNIHMLICQIYKVKELNMHIDDECKLEDTESKNILDMIVKHVSSVIVCEETVHFLDANAGIYDKNIEQTISKQKHLLKKVVDHGVSLIIRLTGEYEKRAGKGENSNSESSISGFEDSLKQAVTDDNYSTLEYKCTEVLPSDPTHGEGEGESPLFASNHLEENVQSDELVQELKGANLECENAMVQDEPGSLERRLNTGEEMMTTDEDRELKYLSEDVPRTKVSSSGTSLICNVSNIALNVEIASSASSQSVLPSLSEVLTESARNQESPQKGRPDVQNVATKKVKFVVDSDEEEGNENSANSSSPSENDPEEEEENSRPAMEEEADDHQTTTRSSRQTRQDERKRNLQCLYNEEEDMEEPSSSSTPKKRRRHGSQATTAPIKGIKAPVRKPGRKKKRAKSKAKDIYASSSEEIIPAPVKRGFQYTDDCFRVFNAVYNHDESDSFCKEIRSADVPGYYKVVKRAMWLDLIAQKLRTGRYDHLEEYVADMRLVFENSRRFNKAGTEVYKAGLACEKLFEEKLAEQFPDKNL